MRKHRFYFALIAMTILMSVAFFTSACGAQSSGESTLEKAKREGYVTIGFANESPYAYETADGELTGEAVEVARVILSRLGIDEVRGELTEFGSLIPGLNANRFDMVTAGMFITPERAQQVSFANPEYKVGVAIGVKAGNPLNLASYEDIVAHDSAKVAVPGGAIEYEYLKDLGLDESRFVIVPDMPSALSALQAGRADVITATGPSLQSTLDAANDPNVERVENFTQPVIDGETVVGYGATAFRKADQEFVDAYNNELKKMQESGELLEILEQFGFTEAELPDFSTVEDVIG